MENLSSIQAAALLTAIESVGDASAKLNGEVPVYVSYNALAYTLPRVLRRNPLGLVNGYWNAFTNITDMLIGAYLGEQLEPQQIAGLFVISAGILLLASGKQTL